MTVSIDTLIIGAGPTGLGAGFRLRELEESNFLIIESEDRVGGLSASYQDEKGFTWDLGGHIHFSHYDRYSQILDSAVGPEGWLEHERDSRIWIRGRYIPYPIQEHLNHLPKMDQWQCLINLLRQRWSSTKEPAKNFHDWVLRQFGSCLARLFFTPYNLKVWSTPLDLMGTSWLGERVAPVSVRKILGHILFGRSPKAWGPNCHFKYPRHGGTGAIWKKISEQVGLEKIRLKEKTQRIDLEKRELTTSAGSYHYNQLLNTSPLPLFIQMADGVPQEVKEGARKLRSTTIHAIGLGIKGSPPKELQGVGWIYYPEPGIPFYRATVLSNHSPNCVPAPASQWALLVEVPNHGREQASREDLIKESIQAIRSAGYVQHESDILSAWHRRCANAYPVPTRERDQVLKTADDTLTSRQVYSRGRLGGWKYEVGNQDHCFMQGMEFVDWIKGGLPEVTYPHPEKVNRG